MSHPLHGGLLLLAGCLATGVAGCGSAEANISFQRARLSAGVRLCWEDVRGHACAPYLRFDESIRLERLIRETRREVTPALIDGRDLPCLRAFERTFSELASSRRAAFLRGHGCAEPIVSYLEQNPGLLEPRGELEPQVEPTVVRERRHAGGNAPLD